MVFFINTLYFTFPRFGKDRWKRVGRTAARKQRDHTNRIRVVRASLAEPGFHNRHSNYRADKRAGRQQRGARRLFQFEARNTQGLRVQSTVFTLNTAFDYYPTHSDKPAEPIDGQFEPGSGTCSGSKQKCEQKCVGRLEHGLFHGWSDRSIYGACSWSSYSFCCPINSHYSFNAICKPLSVY